MYGGGVLHRGGLQLLGHPDGLEDCLNPLMLVYYMYYMNSWPFEIHMADSTPVLLHVAGGAGGRGIQLQGALLQHLCDAPVVSLQLQLELVQLLVQLPQVP